MIGIQTFVLSNQEGFAILKPYDKVIIHTRIRYIKEIRVTSH